MADYGCYYLDTNQSIAAVSMGAIAVATFVVMAVAYYTKLFYTKWVFLILSMASAITSVALGAVTRSCGEGGYQPVNYLDGSTNSTLSLVGIILGGGVLTLYLIILYATINTPPPEPKVEV